jgi:hypothetical protein
MADASYHWRSLPGHNIVFSSDNEFSAVEPGRQRRTSWQRRRREQTRGNDNARRLLPPIGAPRPAATRRRKCTQQERVRTRTDNPPIDPERRRTHAKHAATTPRCPEKYSEQPGRRFGAKGMYISKMRQGKRVRDRAEVRRVASTERARLRRH